MGRHIDERPIADAVIEFFIAVESGKWDAASTLLADQVLVAHGSQRMTLSREELITGWRAGHVAYARTTYRLGPLTIECTGPREATVRCSSRATLLPPPHLGGRSKVIVGRYTIDLEHWPPDTWRIATMRHDEHA